MPHVCWVGVESTLVACLIVPAPVVVVRHHQQVVNYPWL